MKDDEEISLDRHRVLLAKFYAVRSASGAATLMKKIRLVSAGLKMTDRHPAAKDWVNLFERLGNDASKDTGTSQLSKLKIDLFLNTFNKHTAAASTPLSTIANDKPISEEMRLYHLALVQLLWANESEFRQTNEKIALAQKELGTADLRAAAFERIAMYNGINDYCHLLEGRPYTDKLLLANLQREQIWYHLEPEEKRSIQNGTSLEYKAAVDQTPKPNVTTAGLTTTAFGCMLTVGALSVVNALANKSISKSQPVEVSV